MLITFLHIHVLYCFLISMWCSLVVVWVLLPLLAALNSPDGYMEAMNKSKHTLRGTGSAIVNKTYEILNNTKHTLKRSVDKEMEALRNAEYARKVMGNKLVNITLDLCLRDNYHKDEPGPESSLYKQVGQGVWGGGMNCF